MSFYTIDFTVAAQGVTPDTPQAAGHTGDHKAAVVRFAVPFEGYRYRIEIADGGGGYDITDLLTAQAGVVSYAIPSAWTTAGVATLRLIAIEQDEDGTEAVRFHAAPAYLRFEDREDGETLGEHLRPAWQETLDEAQFFLNTVEQKLENGELDGEKGDKGDAGYTPQKGVDYYTDADKQALILEINTRDVDQALDENSERAISNKAVATESGILRYGIDYAHERMERVESSVSDAHVRIGEIENHIGEIETALDRIISIQNGLIGGGGV